MPILKEYTCNSCGHEFERLRAECPACDSSNVKRAFRTPFHIAKGAAKRTDHILQNQFDKLGITNFSNAPGPGNANNVTWKPKTYATPAGGLAQAPIIPSFGLNSLAQLGFNPGQLVSTRDTPSGVSTVPFTIPQDIGAAIPNGVPIGGRPTELFKHTRVIGGIDTDGKSVYRVK